MGYLSRVVLATETANIEQLKNLVTKGDLFDKYIAINEEPNYSYIDLGWIKWGWYENQQPFIDKLHTLVDEDLVAYIRIGEEVGDVEFVGSPWEFDLEVETDVNISF